MARARGRGRRRRLHAYAAQHRVRAAYRWAVSTFGIYVDPARASRRRRAGCSTRRCSSSCAGQRLRSARRRRTAPAQTTPASACTARSASSASARTRADRLEGGGVARRVLVAARAGSRQRWRGPPHCGGKNSSMRGHSWAPEPSSMTFMSAQTSCQGSGSGMTSGSRSSGVPPGPAGTAHATNPMRSAARGSGTRARCSFILLRTSGSLRTLCSRRLRPARRVSEFRSSCRQTAKNRGFDARRDSYS